MPVDITVIEKRALPLVNDVKPSARTTALMVGSLGVLERAGIWPEFQSKCTMLRNLTIIDDCNFPRDANSMITQEFKASEIGQDYFGYNVPLGSLTAVLAEKARALSNITILENYDLERDDELLANADLVIGADGRHSVIREWAGIETQRTDYGQTAITCLISHSKPHHNISTEFHRNGGPCTFVPTGDNQSAVVWVENTDDANAFLKLSKGDFINSLQARSRDILGAIDLVVEPEGWPLITLKADTIIADKTVLVAEAAHVLSPIGAQGLNLTLRDVNALADMIKDALLLGQDIGGTVTLQSYAKSRASDMNGRYMAVNALNKLVNNDNPLIHKIRRAGLKGLDYASPIRHLLMEQGLSTKAA
jgi:2-octaprenyl-6-methoxyphenol hydroxylase